METVSTKYPPGKLSQILKLDRLSAGLRRAIIGALGGTILLMGIVLIPVPGVPCSLVISLGLAVLATEFAWAKRCLQKIRALFRKKE